MSGYSGVGEPVMQSRIGKQVNFTSEQSSPACAGAIDGLRSCRGCERHAQCDEQE
ncbi:MAG: hypothetical protein Q7U82_11945 [Gammaproteobacteria bacterium]|nr:hypothetical protein [Gammaproteobacteria bacterium]